jgi:hypothetical protein
LQTRASWCTMRYSHVYHVVHTNTGGGRVKARDIGVLSLLGLVIWVAGTVYYGSQGRKLLETSSARYWVSFMLSPMMSLALCAAILRWRRIPAASWAPAMLLLAIPGMIGEAVVLSHLGTFMPRLHEGSGGRYGAFLFATYAVVLGVAEVVTLSAGA